MSSARLMPGEINERSRSRNARIRAARRAQSGGRRTMGDAEELLAVLEDVAAKQAPDVAAAMRLGHKRLLRLHGASLSLEHVRADTRARALALGLTDEALEALYAESDANDEESCDEA